MASPPLLSGRFRIAPRSLPTAVLCSRYLDSQSSSLAFAIPGARDYWSFIPHPTDGTHSILYMRSNQTLDLGTNVNPRINGAPIGKGADRGTPNNRWKLTSSGPGLYMIYSVVRANLPVALLVSQPNSSVVATGTIRAPSFWDTDRLEFVWRFTSVPDNE